MRKTLYALLMCTVAFGPGLAMASSPADELVAPPRPSSPAPALPKPGADKGIEEDLLVKEGSVDKAEAQKEEKQETLQEKALGVALGKIGVENTKDNQELAKKAGVAAVKSVQKNTNLFKEALEITKAKTAAKIQQRTDEGLETSKLRKGLTTFRYGAWEFTKATFNTAVSFVKDNPEVVGKIIVGVASALLVA